MIPVSLPKKIDIPSKREMNREELARAETIIAKGKQTFMDVGLALMDIRERKGYRFTHPTFEAYCQAKWGWTASRSRQLISAVETVKELESVTPGNTLVDINEKDARAIKHIGTETVAGELQAALKKAPDPVKAVRDIIRSHTQPAPKPEVDESPRRAPLGDAAPDAAVSGSDDDSFDSAQDAVFEATVATAPKPAVDESPHLPCPVCGTPLYFDKKVRIVRFVGRAR